MMLWSVCGSIKIVRWIEFFLSGNDALIRIRFDPMSTDPKFRVSQDVLMILEPSYTHARHGISCVPEGHFDDVFGTSVGGIGMGVGAGVG